MGTGTFKGMMEDVVPCMPALCGPIPFTIRTLRQLSIVNIFPIED